jgi:hypothetical protein
MRLRRTAPPSAFFTLQPNRLISRPFARIKTVNSRPDRRLAFWYTASYSARRTRRLARGSPWFGGSDARETVAPFLSAVRKHLTSARALHARAESVLLMTCPHVRLISAFRQRFVSLPEWAPAANGMSAPHFFLRQLFDFMPAHVPLQLGCASRAQTKPLVYSSQPGGSRKHSAR